MACWIESPSPPPRHSPSSPFSLLSHSLTLPPSLVSSRLLPSSVLVLEYPKASSAATFLATPGTTFNNKLRQKTFEVEWVVFARVRVQRLACRVAIPPFAGLLHV